MDFSATRIVAQDSCAEERIHLPGAIQPHGMMLVAEQCATGDGPALIRYVAGEIEQRLGGVPWQGCPLDSVIGAPLADRIAILATSGRLKGYIGCFIPPFVMPLGDEYLDVSAHVIGQYIVVELESASLDAVPGSIALDTLEAASAAFAQADSLAVLYDCATLTFCEITGFDRVLIYQFRGHNGGRVVAEELSGALPGFMNFQFPASDIPPQALALYLRNPIRVIPDVNSKPVWLRPDWLGPPLDMSQCSLRSIAPVHLEYLANMGVRASASISIIHKGALWGLVNCHHETPRMLTYEARAACRSLAVILAREIGVKQELEDCRQRNRLLAAENDLLILMAGQDDLTGYLDRIGGIMLADGAALLRGDTWAVWGSCPGEMELRALGSWVMANQIWPVFASNELAWDYSGAASFQVVGSGLLTVTLSSDPAWLLMWFRSEALEEVIWAGNPVKADQAKTGEAIAPRVSFAPWRETARGRARPWSLAEQESAGRLRTRVLEITQILRERDLRRPVAPTVMSMWAKVRAWLGGHAG